jgi:hypothetical protein
MTPFAAALARLDWSVPTFARRFGTSPTLAYGWHRGRNTRGNPCEAPADAMVWLARIARAVEAMPSPRNTLKAKEITL